MLPKVGADFFSAEVQRHGYLVLLQRKQMLDGVGGKKASKHGE